jgi:hypothetical protein
MMGVDEALEQTPEAVAAWHDEGATSWLGIYRVSVSGASLIAHEKMPISERAVMERRLRARGVRIGSTDGEYVWTLGERGFQLWTGDRQVTESGADELVFSGQKIVRKNVEAVVSFVDRNDPGHRGVFVTVMDGPAALVVEEHDPAAEADPAYNLNNAFLDGAWSLQLAADLGAWLGVPVRRELSPPVSSLIDAATAALRELQTRSASLPAHGRFTAVEQEVVPGTTSRGRVALRIAPRPTDPDSGRYLLLLVYSPSGESESSQWLADGANQDIATYLRATTTPAEIESTASKLAESQRREGIA